MIAQGAGNGNRYRFDRGRQFTRIGTLPRTVLVTYIYINQHSYIPINIAMRIRSINEFAESRAVASAQVFEFSFAIVVVAGCLSYLIVCGCIVCVVYM